MKKILRMVIVGMLIACCTFPMGVIAQASDTAGSQITDEKRVLYISSYSFSWGTVPLQIDGIKKELKNCVVNYEFMDTKNVTYSEGYKEFYDLMDYKLSKREPYDAVIVCDDAALNFTMMYKDQLFPDVPVVFSGIDNVEYAKEAAQDPLVTGIVEEVDYKTNVKLAKKLRPDAKKLVFILDSAENGIGIKAQLENSQEEFREFDVSYVNSVDYTKEEFCKLLSSYGEDTIVFCISMSQSKGGVLYAESERYQILDRYAKTPLFRVTQSGVGTGTFLGGYVVAHDKSAELAGKMVQQILDGTSPSQIPLELKTPHEYYFDQNVLDKYDISRKLIPHDAVIQNPKESFFEMYDVQIVAGMVLLIFCALVIILEQKMMSNREYERYNQDLEDTNTKLHQANDYKNEFLTRMSHDMRTPMNAVIGMANLGLDECKEEAARDYFHKINSSGTYLLGLINDILDMSRMESGEVEFKEDIVDSKRFLANIETMMRPLLEKRNIKLVTNIHEADLGYIICDKLRMKQIYVNLLSNAIKFSAPGGQVEWTMEDLRKEGDRVYFECRVRDYGCGMSEAFQTRLFTPFAQEENIYSRENASTGLGLAIVHNLVTQMGGSIEVESTLGEGTCFHVYISHEMTDQKPVRVSLSALNIASLQGRHVLLVEDHPLNVEVATRLLKKEGLFVEHAADGQEAVEIYGESEPGRYDAILMDIRMPRMDGIEATRTIRAMDREDARRVPIIAMTANAFESDKEACQSAGMNAHVAKPIDPKVLYRTLEEYME